jgi:glyoxylase-like metal-dependent hydrolase (beta-lactamase superfamily II)
MKITENLFAYPWTSMWENNCNSYYVGGDVRLLVDPGLLMSFPELVKGLSRDGVDSEKIRYVLITHSHPDHFEAIERFSNRPDVEILMTGPEVRFMEEIGSRFYPAFGLDVPEYHIDRELEDGTISLGGEEFEVIITPGHSPGSMCLYWPKEKALFSGDLIFSRNVGRTDFPGGDGALLKQSIERISQLDIEYLLPGHMEMVAGGDEVKTNFDIVKRAVFPYL